MQALSPDVVAFNQTCGKSGEKITKYALVSLADLRYRVDGGEIPNSSWVMQAPDTGATVILVANIGTTEGGKASGIIFGKWDTNGWKPHNTP